MWTDNTGEWPEGLESGMMVVVQYADGTHGLHRAEETDREYGYWKFMNDGCDIVRWKHDRQGNEALSG